MDHAGDEGLLHRDAPGIAAQHFKRLVSDGDQLVSAQRAYFAKGETLDLSFNRITKIENLEKLTKLKTLYFVHNKITKIEGLEEVGLGFKVFPFSRDAFVLVLKANG